MRTLTLVFCVATVGGYLHFQKEIPNGGNVSHPCKLNDTWEGVGHLNPYGEGYLNPFGQDFKSAGMTWTKTLCKTDSDGDGKTNGEELGDPECIWTKGSSPTVTHDISHPGVCTPYSAPACQAVNTWIDCEIKDKTCDAINEIGMKNTTVRIPETAVPLAETTYHCMLFEFPADGDYHFVAFEPYIDNANVNHHILLFGCDDSVKALRTSNINSVRPCNATPEPYCQTLMGVWNYGSPSQCMHKNAGFRIGQNGYRHAVLQLHWNNPEHRSDYTDSSGMKLYFTSNLRQHDATTLTVGTTYIEIPPGEENVEVEALCSSDCSSRYLSGPIYIISAENHMHLLGRKQKIQLYRKGVWIADITNEVFKYGTNNYFQFTTPIEVLPGDEIKITCSYNSVDQNLTTIMGEDTSDEMCFGFLIVYPEQHLTGRDCASWMDLDLCKVIDFNSDFPTMNGCYTNSLINPFNTDLAAIITNLNKLCKPFDLCTSECKRYVRDLISKNKCFQGTIDLFLRHYAVSHAKFLMTIFAAIDSCKAEIELDTCQDRCDLIA
ncbi:tyramine beta-hydroxylase-like [Ylistrum balloti]|uniref:tyramine beta-hydroxylase-like n=1 Tax=Ylistrum balloti TaxID=509963 RepID=UPI002905DF71|nr:tyramine beta-hydroxylase-like [Ylistrum balloti]